jgi:hypothetical protein
MEATVQANLFAYVALFSWPLVAVGLFMLFPPCWACAVTLIGGEMFLPANFVVRLGGLPPVDKDLMVSMSAVLGCLIIKPRALWGGSKTGRGYFIFILILIVGLYFTLQTNSDSIKVGHRVLPGLTFHDFLAMATRGSLYWWPAFFLGRRLFTKVDDLAVLCAVLTVGGLVYSLFIFVELRMSPQFNIWVYGYRAFDFAETIRGGGYRPSVFMRHGLTLALFMLISLLAATGLARARIRLFGVSSRWFAAYLALVLLACHSAGALVNAVVLVPSLIWMRPRSQVRLATAIAGLVVIYPLLRFYDLIPVDSVLNFFTATFGSDRAASVAFRLRNESDLLRKAIERPWFGWGGWGRQSLYSPWGSLLSTVDGEWILLLGYSGVVGFVGAFGLLVVPIFKFARKMFRRTVSPRDAILGSTVLFMGAAYVFDLLPNSGVAPYLMMIIGALAGAELDDRPRYESPAGMFFEPLA